MRRVIGIAVIIIVCGRCWAQPTKTASTVPPSRVAVLQKGVNLSAWFAQMPFEIKRIQTYVTADDFARIRQAGFDHVRIPVDPKNLTKPTGFQTPDEDHLKLLDDAIDMALSAKLAIIVCPYMEDAPKVRLMNEEAYAKSFTGFWKNLAIHLSSRDPEVVFLQILNEPSTDNQRLWDSLQATLAAQIRQAAPKHTIIAVSNMRANGRGDFIGGFEALQPLQDTNVIYDFHFYDPLQFTHQGATWTNPACRYFDNLPYPSTPKLVQPLLTKITDEAARAAAIQYGRDEWNAIRIDNQIQRVVKWGAKNGNLHTICTEFGVLRAHVRDEDRNNYLRDVRQVLQRHAIGWTIWDYLSLGPRQGFGVCIEQDGKRAIDAATAGALGLKPLKPAATPASSPADR